MLFLSDIFPTGYMAAENCNIQPGDIVAVWGCGPVGQIAIASALLLGAEKVIAIDCVPARLRMAARLGSVETINFEEDDVFDRLKQLTAGRGPDACIDAVGLEAHGATLDAYYDRAKAAAFLATDRPTALRQAIHACRKGGTVSIPGVYGGFLDKMPFGAAFGKGLTFKMGQTHVMKYLKPLLQLIESGRHRSVVRDHAPAADRSGGRGLQDVPGQQGRVHQGGAEAALMREPGPKGSGLVADGGCMNRYGWMAAVAVCAVTVGVGAAQTETNRTVTVTGCVQNISSTSPAGETIRGFLLSNVVTDDAAADTPNKAGTRDTSTSYMLEGAAAI